MGMTCQCNAIPSKCPYFSTEEDDTFSDDFYESNNDYCGAWAQVTAQPQADASLTSLLQPEYEDEQFEATSSIPLTRKKTKQSERFGSHALNGLKAPQLVAKRNLRERNRVQAVNGAFNRLRKAVPIQHARGKRISKVKTLQNAINYIKRLEQLLDNEFFHKISMRGYYSSKPDYILWNLEY